MGTVQCHKVKLYYIYFSVTGCNVQFYLIHLRAVPPNTKKSLRAYDYVGKADLGMVYLNPKAKYRGDHAFFQK